MRLAWQVCKWRKGIKKWPNGHVICERSRSARRLTHEEGLLTASLPVTMQPTRSGGRTGRRRRVQAMPYISSYNFSIRYANSAGTRTHVRNPYASSRNLFSPTGRPNPPPRPSPPRPATSPHRALMRSARSLSGRLLCQRSSRASLHYCACLCVCASV